MKKTITTLILAASACASHAALTATSLTADGSSTPYNAGTTIQKTLDDPFTYNPGSDYTIITGPVQDGGGPTPPGFHGNNANPQWLRYTLTPITTGINQSTTFLVDLWGRTSTPDRDNDFSITLFNGGYAVGNIVGTAQTGLSIPDSAPHYLRTTFTVSEGTTFDRFEIRDTTSANYFTIMETRAAFETVTIPEPSAALLGGLGALALLRRRR